MPNTSPAGQNAVSAPELFNRAVAADEAGRPEEAERLLRIALRVAQTPGMLVTLGVFREHERRYEEARALFRTAVAIAGAEEPRLNLPLALNLLRAGDYAEGLQLYEFREVKIDGSTVGRPRLPYPEWTGGPVGSLAIFPEQGFGDEIMFNRYVPLLRARHVEVVLVCRPALQRLFSRLDAQVIPLGPSVDVPRCDAWAMAPSLPRLFGTTPETVPDPVYLPGGAGGRGVGVMAARRGAADDRDLPPALAAELLALPGAVNLDPAETGAKDFEATREIIAGLERVITIDTAVANLAGAMGKPCWTLVPFRSDWRWTEAGEHSPWYPAMRLFRQSVRGDWAGVVARVKQALAAEA